MARYDLPTYVLHVLGHFWMFAVKITEWLFSLKSLVLWTQLPIVWDKVLNKSVFFDTFLNYIVGSVEPLFATSVATFTFQGLGSRVPGGHLP